MRIIIILISFFFQLSTVMGLDIKIPKKNFFIQIKSKYSTQWIRLFQEKKKWICQTESTPYLELKKNPTKLISRELKNISKEKNKKSSACIQQVVILNNLNKKKEEYARCKNNRPIRNFVYQLNSICRL